MAAHDRMKPTLESPPARARTSLVVAMTLAVLAGGFAFAMPRMAPLSADADEPEGVVSETNSSESDETLSSVSEDEDDDSDAQQEGSGEDNHGSVVSVAAHCDIKGRAHGELVRSIAQNKTATAADATAACDAAKAAAALGGDEKVTGKPEKAEKADKPVKSHGTSEDDGDDSVEDEADTADDSETGPPPKAPKPDHPGKPKG